MSELIAALIAAYVYLIGIGHSAPLRYHAVRDPQENGAANHHAKFVAQARKFVGNQVKSLLQKANSTGVRTQTFHVTDLQAQNLLPANFSDTNLFQQKNVLVTVALGAPATNLIAVAATCGGQAIPDSDLIRMATVAGTLTGEDTGFIVSTDPTNIHGATWQDVIAVSTFPTAACTLAAGDLAAILHFDGTQGVPSTLSRFDVPGVPDATTMHADINAGGNNVLGVNDVTSSTTGRTLANAQGPGQIIASNSPTPVPKNTCPTGMTPNIWGVPIDWDANGNGFAPIGVHVSAIDNGTSWTPYIKVETENPSTPGTPVQITVDQNHGKMIIFTNCQ